MALCWDDVSDYTACNFSLRKKPRTEISNLPACVVRPETPRQPKRKKPLKLDPKALQFLPVKQRKKLLREQRLQKKRRTKEAAPKGKKALQPQPVPQPKEEIVLEYKGNVCNRWRQKGYCIGGKRCHFKHPPEYRGVGAL